MCINMFQYNAIYYIFSNYDILYKWFYQLRPYFGQIYSSPDTDKYDLSFHFICIFVVH